MSLIMRLMVVLPFARKASSEAANLTERKRHIAMYVTVGTDKPLARLICPPFVCGKGSGTSIRNIGYIFLLCVLPSKNGLTQELKIA